MVLLVNSLVISDKEDFIEIFGILSERLLVNIKVIDTKIIKKKYTKMINKLIKQHPNTAKIIYDFNSNFKDDKNIGILEFVAVINMLVYYIMLL